MKLATIGIVLLIGSCSARSEAPIVAPDSPITQQRCEQEGGRWGRGGLSRLERCFPHFSDEGLTCSAGSQCQGYCDAKTRQCSAGIPLGCLTMLGDNGEMVAICID